jgi:hypothetical protein
MTENINVKKPRIADWKNIPKGYKIIMFYYGIILGLVFFGFQNISAESRFFILGLNLGLEYLLFFSIFNLLLFGFIFYNLIYGYRRKFVLILIVINMIKNFVMSTSSIIFALQKGVEFQIKIYVVLLFVFIGIIQILIDLFIWSYINREKYYFLDNRD